MKKMCNKSKNTRGASFIVWVLVIGIVFAALLSSLMSANSYSYQKSFNNYRKLQAMYAAEAGIAKTIADIKANAEPEKNISININRDVIAKAEIEYNKNENTITSKGIVISGNKEWNENITVTAESGSGGIKIKSYKWMVGYEK